MRFIFNFILIFFISALLLTEFNLYKYIDDCKEKFAIRLFLIKENYDEIENKIKGMEGIKSIEFISKERAIDEFEKFWGKSFNGIENPLPPSIKLNIDKNFINQKYIEKLENKISEIEEIDKIVYNKNKIGKIDNLSKYFLFTSIIGGTLLLLLLIVNFSTRVNYIILNKSDEINFLKSIGVKTTKLIKIVGYKFHFENVIFSVISLGICYLIYKLFNINYFLPIKFISAFIFGILFLSILITNIVLMRRKP